MEFKNQNAPKQMDTARIDTLKQKGAKSIF